MTDHTRTPAPRTLDGMARIGLSPLMLRGIRLVEGEGGAAPAAPAADTGAATTPPNGSAAPTPPATPAAPGSSTGDPAGQAVGINPKTGAPYTPEETQAYIASLRDEARTNREARTAAEQAATEAATTRDAILAALGLTPTGDDANTPDPATLQATVEQERAQRDEIARENIVLRVAPSLNANADRLLDSRAFAAALAALGSTDRDGVETLVKEWAAKDPAYTVTSAAASSGGTQHTGTNTTTTGRKSMQEAVKARVASAR